LKIPLFTVVSKVQKYVTVILCLHIQERSGCFGGVAKFSQSELFESIWNCFDWL